MIHVKKNWVFGKENFPWTFRSYSIYRISGVHKIGRSTLRTFGKVGGTAPPGIPRPFRVKVFFYFYLLTHTTSNIGISIWTIPPLILPPPHFSLKCTLFRHMKEKRKVTLIKSKILKNWNEERNEPMV